GRGKRLVELDRVEENRIFADEDDVAKMEVAVTAAGPAFPAAGDEKRFHLRKDAAQGISEPESGRRRKYLGRRGELAHRLLDDLAEGAGRGSPGAAFRLGIGGKHARGELADLLRRQPAT